MSARVGTGWIDLFVANKKLEASLTEAHKTVEKRLGDISKRLESAGKKMTKNVTLPIVAAGTAAVHQAVNVESGIREVMTLFGDLGGQGPAVFDELATGVANLSAEMGVAQDVLVGGLYQAISAGVPRENAFEFMRVATKAAIAGVTDTETAVDGLTSILNVFGLDASQAEAVADSMFTAVKGGKTNFEELSAAIFNVAPAAAAAGVDFREVNAAIATLTSSGTPTSVATTQIRAALVGLQKPSKEMTELFQSYGFESAQAALESEGLAGALGIVAAEAGTDTGALMKLLGSVEAVGAAQVLTGTGAEKFASEIAAQADAAGSTQSAFEEMERSRARQLERAKVSMQNLAITIGTMLLPVVDRLAGWVQRLATWFEGLDDSTKEWIIRIAAVAAAIGPVLLILAKLVSAFKTVSTAFLALSKVMAANPWLLLIAATVALVVLIVKHWDEITAAISAAWEWIKSVVAAGARWVSDLFGRWDIGGKLAGIWHGIEDAVGGTVQWIKDRWNGIVDFFRGVPGRLAGAGSGMFDFLKEAFKSAVNFIIRGWNRLEFKIPGFDPPGPGPKFGGFTLGVPDIPELFRGGRLLSDGLAWVGERGRELLHLPAGAEVTPHRESMALANAGGGGMNFYGPVTFGSRDAADDVDWWTRTKGAGV